MSNVSLRGNAKGVEIAAAGYAAALIATIDQSPPKDAPHFMIPPENISSLAAILKKLPEDAEVVVSRGDDYRFIQVTGESFSWWSALVDAPPYAVNMPEEPTTTMTVNKDVFLAVCQRCHSFRGEQSQYVTVHIDEEFVQIKSPQTEHGQSFEIIDADLWGEPAYVSLDYKNLSNAVQACATDQIIIGVHPAKNGHNLVTVKPVGGEALTCLLAPVISKGES